MSRSELHDDWPERLRAAFAKKAEMTLSEVADVVYKVQRRRWTPMVLQTIKRRFPLIRVSEMPRRLGQRGRSCGIYTPRLK